MAYPIKTLDQFLEGLLRDARNILGAIADGLPDALLQKDSDFYVRLAALAAALEGLAQHQKWISKQILPDTCDPDWLQRHASQFDLTKQGANAATGQITASAETGAVVPVGTEAKAPDGTTVVTTQAITFSVAGSLPINVQASQPGVAGNLSAGTFLTFTSAPPGVNSQAAVVSMTGGEEAETDDDLLANLLSLLREPPAGGNDADYKRWARQVPGVKSAFVYPTRRGVKTVDVAILAEGGLPSSQLVADVQAYIDSVRPTGGDFWAVGPAGVVVNVDADILLDGTRLFSLVEPEVIAALNKFFAALEPGDSVYKSQLVRIISEIAGVEDVVLTSPSANVHSVVNSSLIQIPTLGTITLTVVP